MARSIKITRQVGRPSLAGKAVENWLLDVATWLNEWQEQSGHFTSRPDSSINSYEVIIEKNPTTGEFKAADWLPFAVFGRKSGKFPPATRIDGRLRWLQIEQWIRDKPLSISGGDDIMTVAYLVARKIAEKGTSLPKLRLQNITIVADNFGKKHLGILGDELAEEIADGFASKFKRR